MINIIIMIPYISIKVSLYIYYSLKKNLLKRMKYFKKFKKIQKKFGQKIIQKNQNKKACLIRNIKKNEDNRIISDYI